MLDDMGVPIQHPFCLPSPHSYIYSAVTVLAVLKAGAGVAECPRSGPFATVGF
jgi:hypothetical protein